MHRRQAALFAALILILALLCSLPRQGLASERVYLFMDEIVLPYTYGPEGGLCEGGVTKEIFDEVFGELGLQYAIRLVPWARAMDSVENGDCDGIPLLIKTPEREAFMVFSDPVVENRERLYYLSTKLGDFQWKRLEDLKDLHIGLVRGYAYDKAFQNAVSTYNIRVTYGKDTRMILAMLEAGRVDAVVEDETLAGPLMVEHPEWGSKITAATKSISKYYWRIGIHRDSPLARRLKDINRVLGEMRSDGRLTRILDKRWGGHEAP